jgi:MarR family 2-MHQ and catechol resistance regulon transcriptional repressor
LFLNRRVVPDDSRADYYQHSLVAAAPQYSVADTLSAEVGIAIHLTYDILHQKLGRLMARHGLSKSTMNVLLLLRQAPREGMQLHELGERLLVSRANVTGLVDNMEEKGLVKRLVNPRDRRVRYARITRRAEALLDHYMPVHFRNLTELLGDLTSDEKRTLITLLKRTRNSVLSCASQPLREMSAAEAGR